MDLDEGPTTVVILTALNVEYAAVRQHLSRLETYEHEAGTRFEVGCLRDGGRVAIAVIGMGNPRAAVLTERAINTFRPAALLFVGVAGAIQPDVEVGDVVVATKVYAYHGGREEDDGFVVYPAAWDAPHEVEQPARHVAMTSPWQGFIAPATRSRVPKVHFRPIAAGDVVLNSRDSPSAQRLHRSYGDTAAIEVESAGAAQAAHLNRGFPILIIRGISDRADGAKYADDEAGRQPVAAAHAAAFAVALAAEITTRRATTTTPGPSRAVDRRGHEPGDGRATTVDSPDRPAVTRRGSRRWKLTLPVVLSLVIGVMYLVVRASYARFYAALGLDTGTMPVDAGTLVLATGYAIVLFAVVLLVLLGAFATGAALVPWSERTRADLPAVALFVVLGFAGMVGISLLPGSVSDTVAVLFPVVTLGAVSRMTGREGQWRIIMGLLAGLAATAGVIGLGWAVGIWSGSMTWLIATLFASAIAVIFVLARWTGRELRRSGLRPADDTTPATVLSQMNPIASIVAVIRERMTAGEAHRAVLGVAVGAVVMPAVTLWQLAYLVGSAADAGAAAREYGYVPDDYATATMWSTPVAPATVTLHRPGTDPIGVCGASPPWAASLISRDDTGSWVLLRPIEPGVATAEVVRLAAADYTVRPVLDEDIRQGRPWTVRAC